MTRAGRALLNIGRVSVASKEAESSRAQSAAVLVLNKWQYNVSQLIAGPGAVICDECVRVCTEILGDAKRSSVVVLDPKRQSLGRTPSNVRSVTSRFEPKTASPSPVIAARAVSIASRAVAVARPKDGESSA
jgi:ClpX C4-type zinc finger protein